MHLPPDVYYIAGAYLVIILAITIYNFYRSPTGFISYDRLFILVSFTTFAIALFIEGWVRISGAPRYIRLIAALLFATSMGLGLLASTHTYRKLHNKKSMSSRGAR